ncbi:coiled-coil domain-containing protein 38 isoform X2 [Ascaphus truei]|uniref:coiled-coil domain-containing protein 38 isoform X2 n=1 Tax=Ascaphus truei TaxID=8439 RepID=UPI003F59FFF5
MFLFEITQVISYGCLQYGRNIKQRKMAVAVAFSDQLPALPTIDSDGNKKQYDRSSNPFVWPENDIFLFRSKQRKEREEEKTLSLKLKVCDKTTFASRVRSVGYSRRNMMLEDDVSTEDASETQKISVKCEPSQVLSMTRRFHREKETLNDYISQKREMFLAQYSIDVKQDVIRQLKTTVLKEENKISVAENKLKDDTIVFEEFLKENDRISADALKIADQETKSKQEIHAEIRRATGEMMGIKSDIARCEEIIKEFVTYEDFLKMLSAPEWQEEQQQKKLSVEQAKKKKLAERRNTWILPPITKKTDNKSVKLLCKPGSFKEQSIRRKSCIPDSRRASSRGSSEATEDDKDLFQEGDSDEEETELYFTDPQQLLQIFVQLEEQNLTLIQNSQETDETMQEIRETGYTIQDKLNLKTNVLIEHRDMLTAACIEEEAKAADLELKAKMFFFGEFKSDSQDTMLSTLNKKIAEVYKTCIGELQASGSTLQMLASIESRFEELHDKLESTPRDIVEVAKKAKQKELRARLREDKRKHQMLNQEERLRRALERATAEPKKTHEGHLLFWSGLFQWNEQFRNQIFEDLGENKWWEGN